MALVEGSWLVVKGGLGYRHTERGPEQKKRRVGLLDGFEPAELEVEAQQLTVRSLLEDGRGFTADIKTDHPATLEAAGQDQIEFQCINDNGDEFDVHVIAKAGTPEERAADLHGMAAALSVAGCQVPHFPS